MTRTVMILAAATLLLARAATAADSKDKRAVDGRPLVRVGGGARVVEGAKLYDMTLWVDEQDGRRAFPALVMRAGGRERKKLVNGDHAPAFLVWGRFTKQAVLKFARAVTAKQLRADVQAALEPVSGADAFLALLGDAAAGDEWVLTTGDNGQLSLAMGAAAAKQAPTSPKLVRAVWSVWLGAKALSPELRQQLIEHIDVLGR
jgi:hypothetical protein